MAFFSHCIKKCNACCLKYLSSEDSIRTCWYNLKIPPKKRKAPLLTIITLQSMTNHYSPILSVINHFFWLRFDDIPLSQQETCRHSTVQWENPTRGSVLDSGSTPSVSSVASVGDLTLDQQQLSLWEAWSSHRTVWGIWEDNKFKAPNSVWHSRKIPCPHF